MFDLAKKINKLEIEIRQLNIKLEKDLRIRTEYGGLGDVLQFSTLPERFSELGHNIYLHNQSPFRNEAIRDLLLYNNKYILGNKEGNWDLGDVPNIEYINIHNDFIKNWETLHGLLPVNSFPKIYYQPQKIEDIQGLIELSCISLHYPKNEVLEAVLNIINENKHIKFKQLTTNYQNNEIKIHGLETICADSLFQTADYIYSCEHFVSLNSGTHSLAASVRQYNNNFKQTCLLPFYKYDDMMNRKHFIYPLCEYIKV